MYILFDAKKFAKFNLIAIGIISCLTFFERLFHFEFSNIFLTKVIKFTELGEGKFFPILILLMLLIVQILVHVFDKNKDGKRRGVIGRYYKTVFPADGKTNPEACYDDDKGVIRAFITKQSIFATFSIFLLKLLSDEAPKAFFEVPFNIYGLIFSDYLYVFSVSGFLLVLLTVLVSLQCYTISVRIKWKATERYELLRKGRKFDELSFYTLTTSLMLTLCYFYPLVSLIALPTLSILLFNYYFFRG